MCIITKTRLGLKKTYTLDPRDIKLSCKGINIYNLLKIPKSEEIIEILE